LPASRWPPLGEHSCEYENYGVRAEESSPSINCESGKRGEDLCVETRDIDGRVWDRFLRGLARGWSTIGQAPQGNVSPKFSQPLDFTHHSTNRSTRSTASPPQNLNSKCRPRPTNVFLKPRDLGFPHCNVPSIGPSPKLFIPRSLLFDDGLTRML
jgi:hypothetical protein